MKTTRLFMLVRLESGGPWEQVRLGPVKTKEEEKQHVNRWKRWAPKLKIKIKIYRLVETDTLLYTNEP